jgi:hypothetical protein
MKILLTCTCLSLFANTLLAQSIKIPLKTSTIQYFSCDAKPGLSGFVEEKYDLALVNMVPKIRYTHNNVASAIKPSFYDIQNVVVVSEVKGSSQVLKGHEILLKTAGSISFKDGSTGIYTRKNGTQVKLINCKIIMKKSVK